MADKLQTAVTAARERQAQAAAAVEKWEARFEAEKQKAIEVEARAGELVLSTGELADASSTIAAARSTAAAAERGLRAARRDAELASIELQEAQAAVVLDEAQRLQAAHDAQYRDLAVAIEAAKAKHGGLHVSVRLSGNAFLTSAQLTQGESMRMSASQRRQLLDKKFPT